MTSLATPMGYEYTIQGWYRCDRPVDLNAPLPGVGGYEFVEHDRPGMWLRVTGARRNYVLFATQAKHRANYYLSALSAIVAAPGGGGHGLITVTGEWTYDGKDRLVLARDGRLLTLPTARLYDPSSPWNTVYRWAHYMGRDAGELEPPDPRHLRAALGGRHCVKGWLDLHDYRTSDEHIARVIADVVGQDRRLAGGVESLSQYSQPYLLVGQDGVDAASAVAVMAGVTARHEGSYGLFYCSNEDGGSQVPVAVERGRVRVLPEVRLDAEGGGEWLPTPSDAYEGLGSGFRVVPLRSPLDLHGLFRDVARAVGAEPVEPAGGWREGTGVSGPCYLFAARGLALILTTNDAQTHAIARDHWPFLLIAYLEGPAEPNRLMRHVGDVAACLRNGGIEIAAELMWPG